MSRETPHKQQRTSTAANNHELHETPHFKAGRVKVAVRIRPPFQDEILSTGKNGQYSAVVDARMEHSLEDIPIGSTL